MEKKGYKTDERIYTLNRELRIGRWTRSSFSDFCERMSNGAASFAIIRIHGVCRQERRCLQMNLSDKAWKYRSYWGKSGGITVSGGEPLLQIDFLLELFQKAKERGIHTTIDTSGAPFTRASRFKNLKS